ncbi:restriction endonuclease subunit S [Ruegeria arenilitoris]|uniref:restriction endonuclease subunit S n=1 Tax=Ruegeria arenilitoris TaxID=1173585 RepID=UPI00148057C5|nr:restriction endonuclease subunit S [Ruegeria arenilitoris]
MTFSSIKAPKLRFPGFTGDWQKSSLSTFVDPNRKITYGIVQPGTFVEEGVPLVRGGDYSTGWVSLSEIKRVAPEIDAPYQRSKLRSGDLLMTIVGANTGTIASVPDWLEGANITQTTARIAVHGPTADKGFILQCLKSHIGVSEVRKYVKGAAQPGLNLSDIENFDIPAPTVSEQKKIASFLGAIDKRGAQLITQRSLLEDFKKGCIQQLFSQEIRFKNDEGGDFPDWKEKSLGDVFTWVRTNSFSRNHLTDVGGEVQNIHYGDIHTKFHSNFRQSDEEVPFVKGARAADVPENEKCRLGDVVIADASEDYADIGKAIEIVELSATPLLAGLHTFIARPVPGALALGFSGYLLRTPAMRKQIMRIAQGISVLGLSKGNLEKLTIQLPHPDEQKKIAKFLSSIDIKISLVSEELKHAQTFKKGLLQQMFI